MLIDTGYLADYSETERLITGLGVRISDIRLIISTHCHCDHIGGNKIIQDKSNCDIALHNFGKYFIDTKDDWSLLKKITVYTLLMKKSVPKDFFFSLLMRMHWFKETVDLYFKSNYETKYNEIMNGFLDRGVVELRNGNLYTTVNP